MNGVPEYMRPGASRMENEKGELAFLVLEVSMVLLLFFFMLQTGGSFRWVLGLIIIGLTAVMLSARLLGKTSLLSAWKRENVLDNVVSLQLPRADKQVKGAYKGKELSRAFFEERLREAFLEKVREDKRLSERQMDQIAEDPERLYEVIQDRKLVKFIMESSDFKQVVRGKDYEESKSTLTSLFNSDSVKFNADNEYKKKMKEIMNRMEEWPWT